MNITEILTRAANAHASDVFLIAGLPCSWKVDGKLVHGDGDKLKPEDTEALIRQIYELAGNRNIEPFLTSGDDDFSFAIKQVSRFRVSHINSAALSLPLSESSPSTFRIRLRSAFRNRL